MKESNITHKELENVHPILEENDDTAASPCDNKNLIGNTCLYIHFCKTEKTCTIHCSFQLKSTLEAVKLTTFIPFHTKYDLQEQF